MVRLALLAVALLPLEIAAVSQSEPEHVSRILTISLYAPFQAESAVHIVGFRHNEKEVWFDVSNTSDRTVTDVFVGIFDTAPVGCARQEMRSSGTVQRFPVRIAPHGLAIAARENAYFPGLVVRTARSLGVAHFHSQVWVMGVYFEDGSIWHGSEWPAEMSDLGPPYPASAFDPKLLETEPGTCSSSVEVVEALGRTNEVVFEAEGPGAPPERTGVTVPHLDYSCRFDGQKAICRLPLDGDQTARPGSPARKN